MDLRSPGKSHGRWRKQAKHRDQRATGYLIHMRFNRLPCVVLIHSETLRCSPMPMDPHQSLCQYIEQWWCFRTNKTVCIDSALPVSPDAVPCFLLGALVFSRQNRQNLRFLIWGDEVLHQKKPQTRKFGVHGYRILSKPAMKSSATLPVLDGMLPERTWGAAELRLARAASKVATCCKAELSRSTTLGKTTPA